MSPLVQKLGRAADHAAEIVTGRLMKMAERALSPDLSERLDREHLNNLDIPALYRILDEHAANQPKIIQDSVRSQVAFLSSVGWTYANVRGKNLPHREANRFVMEGERRFLEKMKEMGLQVRYESEVSPEEVAKKPSLILATHQGGGWENYLTQGLTGIESGIVVKGELLHYPVFGEVLQSAKAIPVNRNMLKENGDNGEKRQQEMTRIAGEIAARLADNENMLVFFEGTRSEDGQIAATPRRKAWTQDLLTAIDKEWAEVYGEPGDFQKLLLVFHTMTTMPDVPEKDFFLSRFRLGSTLGAKLVRADGLRTEDSENPYDQATLYGKARSVLKDMLVQIILDQQAEQDNNFGRAA